MGRWTLAWLALVLGLTGCQNGPVMPQAIPNPFSERPTLPPPTPGMPIAPGSVGPATDPFNRGVPAAGVPAANGVVAPVSSEPWRSSGVPATNGTVPHTADVNAASNGGQLPAYTNGTTATPYDTQPVGGRRVPEGPGTVPVNPPTSERFGPDRYNAAPAPVNGQQTQNSLPARTDSNVLPAANWTAASGAEPAAFQSDGAAVDIASLPPAKSTEPNSVAASNGGLNFRSPQAAVQPVSQTNRGRPADYGHDPDYRWVAGRLEYSNIDRCWKLRYIPIDGRTDRYGGSVLLSDSPDLDKFREGQFVTIYGQMEAGRGLPAGYTVESIEAAR